MVGFLMAKCVPCDALILDEIDDSDPDHVICKGCGAKLVPITQAGTRMKGKIWHGGIGKKNGRIAEIKVEFNPQHSHGGALGRREMRTDYQNNRYSEKVTLCETGKVTHFCDEPLTEHQGHGSAKNKSNR